MGGCKRKGRFREEEGRRAEEVAGLVVVYGEGESTVAGGSSRRGYKYGPAFAVRARVQRVQKAKPTNV